MPSLTWILALAAVVAAQTTGTAPTSADYIPATASASCKAYLTTFNTDKKIQACIAPLVTATARFQPNAAPGSSNIGDVNWALGGLCAPSAECKSSDVSQAISAFYTACKEDLTSGSANIRTTFDLLYMAIPLRNSICSKDTDGKYCLNKAKATGHTKRAPGDQTPLKQIDVPTWTSSRIHYLFMNPDAAEVCSECTRQVLRAYVAFENMIPYPMGISHSYILGDQKKIWTTITKSCGPDFMAGILTIANAMVPTTNDTSASTSSFQLNIAGAVGAALLAASLA
jgi:hypothetical protein